MDTLKYLNYKSIFYLHIMKAQAFIVIIIACFSISACNKTKETTKTSPQSVYFSHDLQMETLKGKVNRVDYEFYKDRDCWKKYPSKTPYSLVYDANGNLVSDSRYMYFDDVQRDENGFFKHINTGYVVSKEHHTEWDMVELSYTYDEQGFMESSFKAGMDHDCGERFYQYQDSFPSRIFVGDSDGYIDYEIIETDDCRNWTKARVTTNYNVHGPEGEVTGRIREKYYIQRIIMYSGEWLYNYFN